MPNKFKQNPTGTEANSLFRNGWAIDVTAQNTAGSAAEAARDSLINTYGWSITEGGPV